jgi:hypothetical protein
MSAQMVVKTYRYSVRQDNDSRFECTDQAFVPSTFAICISPRGLVWGGEHSQGSPQVWRCRFNLCRKLFHGEIFQ